VTLPNGVARNYVEGLPRTSTLFSSFGMWIDDRIAAQRHLMNPRQSATRVGIVNRSYVTAFIADDRHDVMPADRGHAGTWRRSGKLKPVRGKPQSANRSTQEIGSRAAATERRARATGRMRLDGRGLSFQRTPVFVPLVVQIGVLMLKHIEQPGSQALHHGMQLVVPVMAGIGRGGRQEQCKYKRGEGAELHRGCSWVVKGKPEVSCLKLKRQLLLFLQLCDYEHYGGAEHEAPHQPENKIPCSRQDPVSCSTSLTYWRARRIQNFQM
jgi:hypothetical protein